MAARIAGLILRIVFLAFTVACTRTDDPYSCFYSDSYAVDPIVVGRNLHWCGPVPRPKH
jgi:hypothetical protein